MSENQNRRATRAAAEQFIQQFQGQPYPASRKVYIEGELPGVKVGMREIELQPSLIGGTKDNPLFAAQCTGSGLRHLRPLFLP